MTLLTRTTPGLAPGTLISDPEAVSTRIRVLEYSREEFVERTLEPEGTPPSVAEDRVVWIDVIGLRDTDWLQRLGTHYGLHPLLLEDVVNVNQRPKVESYAEQECFIVAQVPIAAESAEHLQTEQLSMATRPGLVVSFRESEATRIDAIERRLREGRGRLRRCGADYLTYTIIDLVVDSFQPILTELGTQLEQTELRVLENPVEADLRLLHHTRRSLIQLRRKVLPLRDAVTTLLRDDFADSGFRPETTVYLRDCYDHATRILEQIDHDRELAASLADLYLSTVSNRTNDVMKVLTMIATVFIPLSFLVGLYGMNFDAELPGNMPELSQPYAYPILIVAMGVIVVGFLAFFKRRGWLG